MSRGAGAGGWGPVQNGGAEPGPCMVVGLVQRFLPSEQNDRQTDTTDNNTFPQLRWRAITNVVFSKFQLSWYVSTEKDPKLASFVRGVYL